MFIHHILGENRVIDFFENNINFYAINNYVNVT